MKTRTITQITEYIASKIEAHAAAKAAHEQEMEEAKAAINAANAAAAEALAAGNRAAYESKVQESQYYNKRLDFLSKEIVLPAIGHEEGSEIEKEIKKALDIEALPAYEKMKECANGMQEAREEVENVRKEAQTSIRQLNNAGYKCTYTFFTFHPDVEKMLDTRRGLDVVLSQIDRTKRMLND